MLIVGERLNILNPAVYKAIIKKDKSVLKDIINQQLESGADGLEINLGGWQAGVSAMSWIVDLVRSVSDCPVFLSPLPGSLPDALKRAGQGNFINCVTADRDKLESMLSAAECLDCSLVVLLTKKGFLPSSIDKACNLAEEVLEIAESRGFPLDRLFLDPVLRPRIGYLDKDLTKCAPDISFFMETVYLTGQLRTPRVKIIVGISNISAGLRTKERRKINRLALKMLRIAGINAVILDSRDKELVRLAKYDNVMDVDLAQSLIPDYAASEFAEDVR